MNEARRYIKNLQKNEKAPEKIVIIEQGSEDAQFWSLFFNGKPLPPTNELYGNVAEWNNLFIDIENINFTKAAPVVNQMQDYRDIVEEEQKMKPKLYVYPNWREPTTVFDFEDLQEDSFLVLCVRAQIGVPGHELD